MSEVVNHPMNSFREVRDRWWWFVMGKGGKKAKVPVTNEMLEALMRYRQFLGLSPIPKPDDKSPLIRSIKGTRGLSPNMVYRLVKETTMGAAYSIRNESPLAAEKLESATTHWFRHTSITHGDDNGVRLKYLNLSARHDKFETTALYQHAEDDAWHEEWNQLTF